MIWQKNGRAALDGSHIFNEDHGKTLVIDPVRPEDEAVYTCTPEHAPDDVDPHDMYVIVTGEQPGVLVLSYIQLCLFMQADSGICRL